MSVAMTWNGKEIKDLTDKEVILAFKDLLNQDITLEEAQQIKSGGGFEKIFNAETPDIDFLEVLENSMKSGKPFYVGVPLNNDTVKDSVMENTQRMVQKVLRERDCDSVLVQYYSIEN